MKLEIGYVDTVYGTVEQRGDQLFYDGDNPDAIKRLFASMRIPDGQSTTDFLAALPTRLSGHVWAKVVDGETSLEHYPGGHDHDQSRHGAWSPGSPHHDSVKHAKGAAYHAALSAKSSATKAAKGGGKGKGGTPAWKSKVDAKSAYNQSSLGQKSALLKKSLDDAQLSPTQRKALTTYTGGSYQTINRALRKGEMPKGYTAQIKHMDAALAKSHAPDDMIVKRACGNSLWETFKASAGKEFTDHGFTSTTILPHTPGGFSGVTATIRIPKGSSGAFLRSCSNVPSESEWLLPRGSRFHVISVDESNYSVEMELIS